MAIFAMLDSTLTAHKQGWEFQFCQLFCKLSFLKITENIVASSELKNLEAQFVTPEIILKSPIQEFQTMKKEF